MYIWNLIGYLSRAWLVLTKQIKFWLPYKMSDFDADISDLYLEMARFLKTQARQQDTKSQPLTLRTEYKTALKLTDS